MLVYKQFKTMTTQIEIIGIREQNSTMAIIIKM
jgi:hypothetical protein